MSLEFLESLRNLCELEINKLKSNVSNIAPQINVIEHLPDPIVEYPENGKIYKIRPEDNHSLAFDIGPFISSRSTRKSIILKENSTLKTQEWKCIRKNGDLTFENVDSPTLYLDKSSGTSKLSDRRMILYPKNNTAAQKFNYNIETGLIKTCNGYLSVIDNQIFSTPSSTQKFIFERVIVPLQ
jgi:hypothetical protein